MAKKKAAKKKPGRETQAVLASPSGSAGTAAFKYPGTRALYLALREACRACGFYFGALQYITELTWDTEGQEGSGAATYVPPGKCLPPDMPEFVEARVSWEDRRTTLKPQIKEQYRRLDLCFVARQEAHAALERCKSAADAASGELDDNREAVFKRTTIRVRIALEALRDHLQPWFGPEAVMASRVSESPLFGTVEDLGAIKKTIGELRSLADELRPIAEQVGKESKDPPPPPPPPTEPLPNDVHFEVLKYLKKTTGHPTREQVSDGIETYGRHSIRVAIAGLHGWGWILAPAGSRKGIALRDAGRTALEAHEKLQKARGGG